MFCGFIYVIVTIAILIRGSYIAFIYPQTPNLFTSNVVQDIAFAVIFVCIVMITFVYMLMINMKFNNELRMALSEVKTLKSLLPICSYCKNIRDDENDWQKLEDYLLKHTDTNFSHGICPSCYDNEIAPQLESLKEQFQN